MRIAKLLTTGTISLLALALALPVQAAAKKKAAKRPVAKSAKAAKAPSGAVGSLVEDGLRSMEEKDYAAAIGSFSKAARAGGDSAVHFLLGYAHYQRGFASGDPDTADKQDALETVNAYNTALALDPALSSVAQPYKLHHSLGLSYEALGSYEKAVEAYRHAFLAAPRNPMMPLYAARLRFRMNDIAKSAANLDLALKKAQETKQVKKLVDLVQNDPKFSLMLTSDEHLAVVQRYDSSVAGPKSDGTMLASLTPMNGATMRDSVKGTTPADDRFTHLRRQDKDVLDALSAANDEYKFRRYGEAIKAYNDALSLNVESGVLDRNQVALIYEKVGTAYNKLGQSEQAIKALRSCVQQAPMAAAAHYQLSLAYAVQGRYKESVHALGETLRNAPSKGELKKYMLLAKTDAELEAVRDTAAFQKTIDQHSGRAYTR